VDQRKRPGTHPTIYWYTMGETDGEIRCRWEDRQGRAFEGNGLRTSGGQVENGNEMTKITESDDDTVREHDSL
jgi:hypothetical protein